MANIQKRGDAYRIRVFVRKNDEGRPVFETTTFHPRSTTPKAVEKEVKRFADEFEEKVKSGKYFSGEKITFEDFTRIWNDEWAWQHLTQSSVDDYNAILRNRVFPYIGNLKLAKITALQIQSIYNRMAKEGRKPKTIKRTNTAIRSVLNYAYRMGVVQENVCDRCELPKNQPDDELHYFTVEQGIRFLKILKCGVPKRISAHDRIYKSTGKKYHIDAYTETRPIPTQFQVYFMLAIFGSFRRGELIGMTWHAIDFENHVINVTQAAAKVHNGVVIKTPKTKSGKRSISMPDSCFQLLTEWKQEEMQLCKKLGSAWEGYPVEEFDSNFIFIQLDSGRMMSVDTPTHKFKTLLEEYNAQCENEEDKLPMIRLHDLRHTSVTLLLAENADIETVSRRAGHSHASTTLDVYGHFMEKKDREASDILEKLLIQE